MVLRSRQRGRRGSAAPLLGRPFGAPVFQQAAHTAALALARIEAHYFMHDAFLPDGAILGSIDRLRRLPATIVQGRYDMVCPLVTADSLARAWPEADFVVVPDAGHSALEPGIRGALVRATEAMKFRLG